MVYKVELGQTISEKMKEDFGAYMAKILFEIIEGGPNSPMARSLMVTPPFVNYKGLSRCNTSYFPAAFPSMFTIAIRKLTAISGRCSAETCASI